MVLAIAEADRDGQLTYRSLDRFGGHIPHQPTERAIGHDLAGEHARNGKLFPAQTGDKAILWHFCVQPDRDLSQDMVAHIMAVGIIHALEIVDVGNGTEEGPPDEMRAGLELARGLEKGAPIGQAGQLVLVRDLVILFCQAIDPEPGTQHDEAERGANDQRQDRGKCHRRRAADRAIGLDPEIDGRDNAHQDQKRDQHAEPYGPGNISIRHPQQRPSHTRPFAERC